jgi:Cu2+-exporting ATPase
VLLEGETEADEALLTGESRPVAKRCGDVAIAGSINLRGAVVQRADRVGADTRYEGIVALMRTAMTDRPPLLRAADRVAGPFLWGVLVLAAAAAVAWSFIDPSRAVWVAVSVLIVTCPCALSLAAPSALLAAAGALVRRGVLVQRFEALEALASLDTICFDKTGTLTEPGPEAIVVALQPAALRAGMDEAAVRALAGALGAASTHPLSAALAAQAPAASAPLALVARRRAARARRRGASPSDGRRYRLGARPGSPRRGCAACARRRRRRPRRPGSADRTARSRASASPRSCAPTRARASSCCAPPAWRSSCCRATRRRASRRSRASSASPRPRRREPRRQARRGRRAAGRGPPRRDGRRRPQRRARDGARRRLVRDRRRSGADALARRLRPPLRHARRRRRGASDRARAMRVVRQNLAWAIAYNAVCVPVALLGWFPPWAAGLGMATSSLVVVSTRCASIAGRAPARSRSSDTMSYRTIAVHLDASPRCATRVALAARLAVRHGGRLVGIAPTGLPDVIVAMNSAIPRRDRMHRPLGRRPARERGRGGARLREGVQARRRRLVPRRGRRRRGGRRRRPRRPLQRPHRRRPDRHGRADRRRRLRLPAAGAGACRAACPRRPVRGNVRLARRARPGRLEGHARGGARAARRLAAAARRAPRLAGRDRSGANRKAAATNRSQAASAWLDSHAIAFAAHREIALADTGEQLLARASELEPTSSSAAATAIRACASGPSAASPVTCSGT